jgi:peptidoglycan/LPS O-acetylase OafA/YrhL
MKSIFFFISILIVYGSLYPFNFNDAVPNTRAVDALLNFDITKAALPDLIANIILFIPFGIFLRAAFPKNNSAGQLLLLTMTTFLFAYSIQAMQLFTEDRLPWGGDAIWNTIGFTIGVFLYTSLRLDLVKRFKAIHIHQQISFYIAFAIIGLELAPFAPSIDVDVFKENIKLLLNSPSIDWYWTFENTVFWLVAFYLLKIAFPVWGHINKLCILVIVILMSKFLIIYSNINLSSLVGGIFSLIIWRFLSQKINAQQLAILLLITILGNGLYPFELREQLGTFKWLPFSAAIEGNVLINILAFSKKLVFYGGAVWLLYLAKRRLLFGVIICSIIVLLSEFLQIFVINSVADSTDFFIVLIVSFIIHKYLKLNLSGNESQPHHIQLLVKDNIENTADSSYIAGLDGLRAIGALAVFFVHFQQFTGLSGSFLFIDFERWMMNGNTGVALFFVLSGFLLSIPFWHSFKSNQFPNIKHYFINRATRIIPLYYICLVGLLAIKGFQGSDVSFNNIISHLVFLHNLKDNQVMSLNPPFWTLAVEFQFYLLLPLLFVLLFKLGLRKAQILCFLLIPVIYLSYRYFMGQMVIHNDWPISIPLIWPFGVSVKSAAGQSLTYSLFAHLPHFLIGMFLASLYKQKTSKWAEVVFWLSVGLVFAILATELDDLLQLDFGRYNFPFVAVLLGLIVFTAPQAKWARRFLEFTTLKWLGVISYGIYIFHYPIQKATLKAFEAININISQQVPLYLFITLLVTLLVSHITNKLVERPVMKRFKHASLSSELKNTGDRHFNEVIKSRGKVLSFVFIASVIVLASIALTVNMSGPTVRVEQAYWAGSKTNRMIFDHHAHTHYSDGGKSVEELAEVAYIKGCDAFSITAHSQKPLSFSSAKLIEIAAMRKKYPVMLIFSGIDVGISPYGGLEHVSIITTPEYESETLGAVMSALQTEKNMPKKERDLHVLNAINHVKNARDNTIAIYNHPSRKNESYSDISSWNKNVNYITAIAGAPWYQEKAQIGSYQTQTLPIDRRDPIVASVDGTWDKLLAEDHKIWAAITSSDYHNDAMDYGPCELSRIHVDAPTKDYRGLIKGIKAGSFWADQGKLLRDYEFTLESKDDGYRVYPGGTIKLMGSKPVLSVEISANRSESYKNDFLRFDLITNCSNDEVVVRSKLLPPEESSVSLLLPIVEQKGTCFLRSRISLASINEDKLMAYSNPIFIIY